MSDKKKELYRVVMTGDDVLWQHRDTPEHWLTDDDGAYVRDYTAHEDALRDAHDGLHDADERTEDALAALRENEAGDRIPVVVVKPARGTITLLAASPEEAERLASRMHPEYHTIESVEAVA